MSAVIGPLPRLNPIPQTPPADAEPAHPETAEAPQFTSSDLQTWAEHGLIAPEQVRAIKAYLATGVTPAETKVQRRRKLDLLTIAYYFGGFMILLGYSLFVGLQWEDLGEASQLAIAAASIAVLWAIGTGLLRSRITLAGDLLIFAGTGLIPLLVYTIENVVGVWPEERATPYAGFYREVLPAWIVMELTAMAVATAVLWRVRFPLLTLLIAFWGWLFAMDLAAWVARDGERDWSTSREKAVSLAVGLTMVATAIVLQRRATKDYSFWLYLSGFVTALGSFMALAFPQHGLLAFAVYPAFSILVIVGSDWLERRLVLLFGLLGYATFTWYVIAQSLSDDLSTTDQAVSILAGLALIAAGFWMQRCARKDRSLWLYLLGHLTVLYSLSALAIDREGLLGLVVYPAFYLGVVVASVYLQRRLFLVFGAVGFSGYLSYLAAKTFHGTVGFSFGIAIVGLIVILTAVGYQRFGRAWLEQFVGRHRSAPPATA